MSLLKKFDCFLFDCDGVLWNGDEVVPGVVEVVNSLYFSHGKEVMFVTNNATRSMDILVSKLRTMGITIPLLEEKCCGPTSLIPDLVSRLCKKNESVMAVGHEIIKQMVPKAFELMSIPMFNKIERLISDQSVTRNERWAKVTPLFDEIFDGDTISKTSVIVLGFDIESCWAKVAAVLRLCEKRAALMLKTHIVLTNRDVNFPSASGLLPGAGTVLSTYVQALSQLDKSMIRYHDCGKPHDILAEKVASIVKTSPGKTVMVGDNCLTDILFGMDHFGGACLVRTGVHDDRNLEGLKTTHGRSEEEIYRVFVLDSVSELCSECTSVSL